MSKTVPTPSGGGVLAGDNPFDPHLIPRLPEVVQALHDEQVLYERLRQLHVEDLVDTPNPNMRNVGSLHATWITA